MLQNKLRSETQYYFEEKTEREIAKEEGLKHQSIHDSLEYGKEKIKNF